MSIKEANFDLALPLSQWPVFYIDDEAFIYDDTDLFLDENGESMGQDPRHSKLAIYIYNLLVWVYRAELCTITFDLYHKAEIELAAPTIRGDKKAAARLSPDVSFIRAIVPQDEATYTVGKDGPSPNVIFEVSSRRTYRADLFDKFRLYAAAFSAKEYFMYDPHRRRLWQGRRLKAWRLVDETFVEIEPNADGWVWSEELQNWLVEDGRFLRMYNRAGERLLTGEEEAELLRNQAERTEAEVEQLYTQVEQAHAQTVQEKLRTQQAQAQVEQEKQRTEQAQVQTEQAQTQLEQEKQRTEQVQTQLEQEKQRAEQAEARIKWLEEQLRKSNPDLNE